MLTLNNLPKTHSADVSQSFGLAKTPFYHSYG